MLPLLTACAMAGPTPELWVTFFAAQPDPYRPQRTHTFATVHKPGGEMLAISWLPATMKVRGLAVMPMKGHNWSLAETLSWCREHEMEISVWGPYPARADLWNAFAAQVCELQSGRVKYKALDALKPNRRAINCTHAVQEVVTMKTNPVGPFGYGEPTTRETVERFSPYILNWNAEPGQLAAIGVDARCVQLKPLCPIPTRGENLKSFLP